MDGERLYTLSEAHAQIGRARCATEGHDVLWIPTRYEGDGPNTPGPLYGCARCPVRCLVVYPLDHIVTGEYGSFVEGRRVALRKQCTEGRTYKYSMEGHNLVHLDREEWVCSRCDALITFQEQW